MAEILVQVKKWLTPSKINIENFTSRLFYQITFGFCLGAFVILFSNQYFGSPMECEVKDGQSDDKFTSHCWKHGTSLIDKLDIVKNAPCLPDDQYPFDEKKTNNKLFMDIDYYQWIVFVLLINGVVFRTPHAIWKSCEKGHIKCFYSEEAKSASILTKDDLKNELLNKNSNLFNQLKGSLKWYHITFVVCQLLNFLLVPIMFYINDLFLNGKFAKYGIHTGGKKSMCLTFPTQTSCNRNTGGIASSKNTKNGICQLNQNILNQYIFLILWVWFVILGFIGFLQLLIETFTVIPKFRVFLIKWDLPPLADENRKIKHEEIPLTRDNVDAKTTEGNTISKYLNGLEIGDWFLLYQISKNMNKQFFYEFIKTISTTPQNDVEANTRENSSLANTSNGNPIQSEESKNIC